MTNIGVVIPAYNEEDGLPRVLKTISNVDWLSKIVLVNDGSTDGTLPIAQEYSSLDERLLVEHSIKNRGKGAALLAGVKRLTEDIEVVIFLDADLIGLSEANLVRLCEPIIEGRADMTVAVFCQGYWRTDISQGVFPNLGGQRCLLRETALEALTPLEDSGYGVEIGLTSTAKHNRWRVVHVDWQGTTHTQQEASLGWKKAFKVRSVMYRQIIKTWSRTTIHQLQESTESHALVEKFQRLLD
jgi:glycosyltransferase involved in cell wall biosynthesis